MTELFRHIGPDTDVPAGDIGVGGRKSDFCSDSINAWPMNSPAYSQEKELNTEVV